MGHKWFEGLLAGEETGQQQVARLAEILDVFGQRDKLPVHRLNENLETLPQ